MALPAAHRRRRHPEPTSSLFRSEEMALVQLYIPSEVAQPTVSALGEMGCVQFRDLNSDLNAFQRAFVNEIRRLEDMDRKIRFLSTRIEKEDIAIRAATQVPVTQTSSARTAREIDELEEQVNLHDHRVHQMNNSHDTLKKRYLELAELRHVLRETARFFEAAHDREDDIRHSTEDLNSPLLNHDLEAGHQEPPPRRSTVINIGFVAGTIPRGRLPTFERILWRALRGNLFMNSAEIDEPIVDPTSDESVEKNVFIIFAHGNELLAKIRKISESLGATLYPIDPDADRRRETMFEVTARIEDLTNVLQSTKQARRQELVSVSERITDWNTIVKKEKAIYYVMNLFNYDPNRKCLIAEGWCPRSAIGDIQRAMREVIERSGANMPSILHELRTHREPPTYHRTNKFTKPYQAIIDAYGMAQYREVNPGLFTVISFPFLFAMMFGDLGHGFLMTCFALWMIRNERKLQRQDNGEIFGTFFGGRYIIVLMGIFSMFTGLIYNDIFSRSLYIASPGWTYQAKNGTVTADRVEGYTYPFGVDPTWHLAENALIFTNSYKMKMSIVFGVLHMSFGICLQVFNHRYFRHDKYIWAEFLPQIIFMLSIFGYLVICIIAKWLTFWPGGNAPSLLNMLIYMFLSPGTVTEKERMYRGQEVVQVLLILVALVCVPWMLLAKPLLLRRENRAAIEAGYSGVLDIEPTTETTRISSEGSEAGGAVVHQDMSHEEEFNFADIMVHQTIHTIEFCLACISNTASYLRLWALSLAHAQLSEVLWQMVLESSLRLDNWFILVAAYFLWINATVGILLVMEGLSAFLHALRLHWVEFNGKFYQGTGYMFVPFSFNSVLQPDDD